MAAITITGKYLGAMKTEFVGQNSLAVRKFYLDITTNPDYPNTPEFQLRGDKVNLVDNLTKGQEIQVSFNLNGRKYKSQSTGKEGVITNIDAWKIDVINRQSAAVAPASARPASSAPAGPAVAAGTTAPAMGMANTPFAHTDESFDDLPF